MIKPSAHKNITSRAIPSSGWEPWPVKPVTLNEALYHPTHHASISFPWTTFWYLPRCQVMLQAGLRWHPQEGVVHSIQDGFRHITLTPSALLPIDGMRDGCLYSVSQFIKSSDAGIAIRQGHYLNPGQSTKPNLACLKIPSIKFSAIRFGQGP